MEILYTACCQLQNRTNATALQAETAEKEKGRAVQLQAWAGPEGSRKLRFPDFVTTAQYGSKIKQSHYRPGQAQRVTGS
jgi:hypothetical protein